MTLSEIMDERMKPVRTVLHPPIDGVWGYTLFRQRQAKGKGGSHSYYVASIHNRDKHLVYGQPIPISVQQYVSVMGKGVERIP